MTAVASTLEFVSVLQEHQLLEPTQLKDVAEDMQTRFTDAAALSRALIERGWLTNFQVNQILNGRGAELVIGPYRILELLGEGGMGQVFKALHRRLYRVVALKVIRQDRLSKDPEVVRRFQREAQAAAQLAHPNVVLIYDADQVDQRHFLTMEYVEGDDLTHLVKAGGPLPVARACEYIRQAALGLQHAHERGLIHRDIKPSNLLVTRAAPKSYLREAAAASGAIEKSMASGEDAIGIVKVLDMGLARVNNPAESPSGASSFHTEAGVVMGTPDFIAPEQARNPRGVDHRADLYSLGCTFYYLLTGRPPFVEGSAIEKMLCHQMDEPDPIEELRPDVPASVGAVIRRLMAKRPADRYNTAQEVADVLAALATPAPGATPGPPPKAAPATHDSSPTAVVRVTPVLPTPNGTSEATILKPATTAEGGEPAKRIALLRGHRSWVLSAAFSPDRNLLASGGVDGTVHVWGFSSTLPKEQVLAQPFNSEVHAVAFGPDNQTLATASGALDGTVALWVLAPTGVECRKRLQGHQAPVEALAFTPDGKTLASGGADCVVRLWDVAGADARERRSLKGHVGTVQVLAVSPDGKTLASGAHDSTVRLWGFANFWKSEQALLSGHYGNVTALAFAPDGKTLASGGADSAILLWDLTTEDTRRPRTVLEGHQSAVRQLIYPADNNTLLSVSDRGRVILWDLETGKPQREWPSPGIMVCCLALTFDGRYLAIGKNDGSIAVFRQYPKRGEGAKAAGNGNDE